MLNGVDPIIIFNFKKLPDFLSALSPATKIPVVAGVDEAIDLPAIPIYLSEQLTGIYIDTEDKSIEIETTVDALTNGGAPQTTQRPIQSTVKISMTAHRDSIGLSLFAAMTDLIIPKVSSKEYSITYVHGAIVVFAGLLHSFNISQNANDELYQVTLELIKPADKTDPKVVQVAKATGTIPLGAQ